MEKPPLPIGRMHVRDFAAGNEQRRLATLQADGEGYVRFTCSKCPRTGKVRLAKLRERFSPSEGLVNILNTLAPKDCPHAQPDPSGNHACGFRYRDLGG